MSTSAFTRDKRPLLVIAFLSAFALLAVTGSARAERPGFYSAPYVALGEKVVGSTLAASDGSLNCAPKCEPDGPSPEYAGRFFQWLICEGPHGGGKQSPAGGLPDEGGPCPGAVVVKPRTRIQSDPNANLFKVRPEDAGKYIQVEVIGVNYDCGEWDYANNTRDCRYVEGHGWSTTFGPIAGGATPPTTPPTAPTPPKVAVAPTYTALPSITGEPEDLQTLTVSNGTWSGTEPLEFTYQWQRCSKANAGCKPIEGATGATYTLTAADVAARLTAMVTVENDGGSFTAAAPLTPKIAGAKPRAGRDSLDVSALLPRHKLRVQSVALTPQRLRPGGRWVARITVADLRGFLISGVEVTVQDELGDVSSSQVLTNARGVATLRLRTTRFVPAGRLILIVTASKPDDETMTTTKRVGVTVTP